MTRDLVVIAPRADTLAALDTVHRGARIFASVDDARAHLLPGDIVVLDGPVAGAGTAIDRLRGDGAAVVSLVDPDDHATASRAIQAGVHEVALRPITGEQLAVRLELARVRAANASPWRCMETNSEATWVLDDEHQTRFVSAALAELLGRPAETFHEAGVEDLIPDHDRPRFVEQVRRSAAGERLSADIALQHADGSEVWLTIRTSPFVIPDDGGRGVIAIARDITERLRTENALRRSEARYRALAETAPDRILILAADGSIEFISRGFDDEPVDALIGAPFFDRVAVHDRERARSVVERALAGGSVAVEELDVCCSGGRDRRHVCRLRRIEDSFGPDRLVGFLTDVTELKRVQAELDASQTRLLQAQRMEAVGRLAGGLAHDFNNILSVVSGCASFIAAALRAEDPILEDVQRILEASSRAESLTRQLLAFSRRQVLRPVAVDLGNVVRGLQRMLVRLLGEHVLLRIDTPPDLPRVRVDIGQIEQVVLNLATNARDWMGAGGTITIATATRTVDAPLGAREGIEPGLYAALIVTDTGPGLADDDVARVFEPFFRRDAPGDNGLLLASVYGIVQQSGGAVLAESEPGRGTTFTVFLPADTTVSAPPSESSSRDRATILIVEDDPSVRYVLKRVLDEVGYRTLTADGPEEALAIVERHGEAIDLLLTDVVMPRMSGPQLARCLEPLQPRMRVLYVTGYLDDTTLRLGLAVSGAAIVHKPFVPTTLVRRISEMLDSR